MKMSVTVQVSLPISITKKEKYFFSCCPILDVWSQGETELIAVDNLREALQLFLIDCFERGTLDKVLKDCGFIAQKKPLPKKQRMIPSREINVPLPFIIDRHLAQCRE
jgi:predicted RNase H-like HicB family nuclease